MKDIAIILWKYHKQKSFIRTIVSYLITVFTGQSYTHAGIYFKGSLYQSTVLKNKNGVMKSEYNPADNEFTTSLVFRIPLNMAQHNALKDTLNTKLVEHLPYNYLKLFVLMLVYPTRWFWNKIGWVPFQSEFFGNVCSVFVDSTFKDIGIDLLPDNNEEYTAPGDFLKSKLLEEYTW